MSADVKSMKNHQACKELNLCKVLSIAKLKLSLLTKAKYMYLHALLTKANFNLSLLTKAKFNLSLLTKAKFNLSLLTKAEFNLSLLTKAEFNLSLLTKAKFFSAYKGKNYNRSPLTNTNFSLLKKAKCLTILGQQKQTFLC